MTMLKYNKNKKFKIMQITDIQEVPKISPDTKKLLNAVIEQEKPDLVVLTGDQIKGYGASYKVKGRDTVQALKETLEALLKPITDAGILAAFASPTGAMNTWLAQPMPMSQRRKNPPSSSLVLK